MTAADVLRRLRRFLLILALLLFAGTLIELWLVNHTEDAIQWVAFALAGLGLLVVLLGIFYQHQTTVRILRACMAIIILGSLFGVYEHVWSNLELEREINPNAPATEMIFKALGGANPLLAPGTLAVAAMLSLAATYKYLVGSDSDLM
jgi:hypothetical protein